MTLRERSSTIHSTYHNDLQLYLLYTVSVTLVSTGTPASLDDALPIMIPPYSGVSFQLHTFAFGIFARWKSISRVDDRVNLDILAWLAIVISRAMDFHERRETHSRTYNVNFVCSIIFKLIKLTFLTEQCNIRRII